MAKEVMIRVTNTTSRILGLPQIGTFLPHPLGPGGNDVKKGHFQLLADNRVVVDWVDKGWLNIEETGVGEPEGPDAPASLEEYGEEGAIKLANLEDSLDTLNSWRDEEDRLDVIKALNSRIAQLSS